MPCMESGEDIHLKRTTGYQPNLVRHNNGQLLAQARPTASCIRFILVDKVSREPVTHHAMYGEWRGYPLEENHRLST